MGFFSKGQKAKRNHLAAQMDNATRLAAQVGRDGEEDTLAVLEDVDTGTEFYMDIIDKFTLEGCTYVAMFPMLDKFRNKNPELVILRLVSGDGQAVNTYFESVRERRELEMAFATFTARYERNL